MVYTAFHKAKKICWLPIPPPPFASCLFAFDAQTLAQWLAEKNQMERPLLTPPCVAPHRDRRDLRQHLRVVCRQVGRDGSAGNREQHGNTTPV
jgi:hypothetical protein